jgi:light-regulated signal transduction histidine kinase (bacteriophytochrome)
MKEPVITSKRLGGMLATLAGGSLLLGACGGEIRAERQGQQLGQAICDVKQADSVDEAQRQLEQAQREMNDLQRIVGRPIEEDVADIEENLDDLVEHVVDGNDALLDQDIAVIQRNIDAVERTLTGKGEAAYDGIQEGLADCDY